MVMEPYYIPFIIILCVLLYFGLKDFSLSSPPSTRSNILRGSTFNNGNGWTINSHPVKYEERIAHNEVAHTVPASNLILSLGGGGCVSQVYNFNDSPASAYDLSVTFIANGHKLITPAVLRLTLQFVDDSFDFYDIKALSGSFTFKRFGENVVLFCLCVGFVASLLPFIRFLHQSL